MHPPSCLCCECLKCPEVADDHYIDIAPAYRDSDDELDASDASDADTVPRGRQVSRTESDLSTSRLRDVSDVSAEPDVSESAPDDDV
jgi:hypothetical protein